MLSRPTLCDNLIFMKKTGLFYDDVFLRHETPAGHPECKERLVSIINAIDASDLKSRLIMEKPRKATRQEVEYVHSPAYFERLSTFEGYYDQDTYVSEGSFEAALYAAGAVMKAVEQVKDGKLERAFCAVRPPGHHAERDRAMGFCLFNNIAIGARKARELGFKKIFIVDFDVHHGNGTQQAFYEDPDVFYFSTHQYPFYPGTGSEAERGAGSGLDTIYNVPMQAGSGVKQYLRVYQDILPPLMQRFKPDIVMVSAGNDIYSGDPLAAINVSGEGIRAIIDGILAGAGGKPSIFVLEGGYNLDAIGELVIITLKELLDCEPY